MQGPPPHLTGDLAYRIVVKASDMKAHPGLRDLAEKPAINYWLGPSAHVVCYLLRSGDLYNIVLICPDDQRTDTAQADLQEMRAIFKKWDPKLQILLGLVQESSRWRLQDSKEMGTWVRGKFALLGDACHASLPYLYVFFHLLFDALNCDTRRLHSLRPPFQLLIRKLAPNIPQSSRCGTSYRRWCCTRPTSLRRWTESFNHALHLRRHP